MMDPEGLLATIRRLAVRPAGRLRCAVAFSGGLDSTVLLVLLARARAAHPRELGLRALHVDHGLQPAARDFRTQARRIAAAQRVPLAILRAQVQAGAGRSLEEAAREARHAALRAALAPGELLLTAQHADDQLETLLLALMRGAGPAGLAGMAPAAPFGATHLLRPLLGNTREELLAYARSSGLDWIEDPTNASLRFDRNYLRQQVLPALRSRWPAAAVTAARSARHCAEAARLIGAQGLRDLQAAQDGEGLDAAVLRRWAPARQRNVLRAWCVRCGVRVPDERRLGEALRMLEARSDASPVLQWPGARLRLHRGQLLLVRAPGAGQSLPQPVAPGEASRWDWQREPELAIAGIGTLALRADPVGDLDLARLPELLWVRWPRTGQAREAGQGERTLRKRLQSLGVPAWQRDRLPLIGDTPGPGSAGIVAIADLWLDPRLLAQPESSRRGRIVWRQGG